MQPVVINLTGLKRQAKKKLRVLRVLFICFCWRKAHLFD